MKIKNKNFLPLSLLVAVLAVGVFLVDANQANAVTFAQDTTWAATNGNITIVGGSTADEVTTTATTMTITLSSGQTMTLSSPGKLFLSNTGGYSYICSSTESRMKMTSSTTKTFTVTPASTGCDTSGGSSSSSGGGGGGGTTITPTPTPSTSATPTPAPTPTSTPTPTPSGAKPTPASQGFVSLEAVSLNDGDVVSAVDSADPDVYIVNPYGYKRLFLNPAIFGFYGHLGGFSAVKGTTSATRDVFVTSGLFRNCETDDPKVYGVEITGEDVGTLHWVNTTGEQAVADDPEFFKKVFCINTSEFNWYPQGSDYTSVNQIPDYSRDNITSSSVTPPTPNQYKVVSSVGYLNVRALASTASAILGQLAAGDVVTSLAQDGVWHKIMFEGQEAWVHGSYLKVI